MAPHIDSAAAARLHPAFAPELAIACADGIRVNMEASRKFTGAGESLSRLQIVAQDAQNDLRYELFAETDMAATGEPELHGAIS